MEDHHIRSIEENKTGKPKSIFMTKRWNLVHNEGKMSVRNVLSLLSQHSDGGN